MQLFSAVKAMEAARFVQAVHDGEAEAALCGALGEEGGGRCVVEGDERFVDAGGDGGEVAARSVVFAEVFRDEIREGGAGLVAREDADGFALLLEDADLAAERGVHVGPRALDEGERRFGGVVAVFHAGGLGDSVCADECGVEADAAEEFLEHFARDGAGAQDGRGRLGAVDDGGFDAEAAGAAVEDEGDAPLHVAQDGGGGRGARTAGDVGGGSGDGDAGRADHGAGDGVFRHADADGREAAGDAVGNDGFPPQDEGDGAGAEGREEFFRTGRDVGGDGVDHRAVCDVEDQGVVRGASLRFVDARAGSGVEAVCAEAVDGLGRERDEAAAAQDVAGAGDGGLCRGRVGDLDQFGLHKWLLSENRGWKWGWFEADGSRREVRGGRFEAERAAGTGRLTPRGNSRL